MLTNNLLKASFAFHGLAHHSEVIAVIPQFSQRIRLFDTGKIPMLIARGFPPPWSVTYTDHAVDLPVIAESAQWFLVNPKPKSLAKVREHMQCEPSVLSWR